ncbi:MAG: hypothetical protein E6Q97_22305 [Desulfurellales bacterium]|nr:MAG: hypothetical protein E6Q97_22305 [Desulfurellales bacterium]
MAQSDEVKRAYRRGYSSGYNCRSSHRWPDHKPPEPPNEIVAEIMRAATKLRDAVDIQLATLGDDDEWQHTLGDPMDEVTVALEKVSAWLRKTD